ncbi:hypothetical protein HOD38_02860 [archaeon]|nr:hypothetical protein [archaeon]MBT4397182.1 hypothetical protein [archaeon]MBT4440562.1 hypothetical protein [archaeon]
MDHRFYLSIAAGVAAAVGLVVLGRDVNTPPQIDVPVEERVEQLVNDDCNVGFIYNQLRESLWAYDGLYGLSVNVQGVEMESSFPGVEGFIGYDAVRDSVYFRETDGLTLFFEDGYVPQGDSMACNLATRLLSVNQRL